VGITVTSKQQQRIVPLIPELVELLDGYLLARRKAGYSIAAITPLFINLYNRPKYLTEEEQDYRLSRLQSARNYPLSYLADEKIQVNPLLLPSTLKCPESDRLDRENIRWYRWLNPA
jgi:integrase